MKHYDQETLSRYALDRSLVDDPEAIATHLAACDGCRDSYALAIEIDEALRDRETWTDTDALIVDPPRLQEAVALKRTIDAEEEAAARRIEPLLTSPLRFRGANIAADRRLRTAGAVRVLCAEAHKRHEQRPLFSLEIADAAFAIALALKGIPGRRYCMGLALRERGNALRYIGRFGEALEALAYAEKFFDESPPSDAHDIAIVQFIRATVLMKSERLRDAIDETDRCLPVFRVYRDRQRELSALLVRGGCFDLSGSYREAALAYEHVIGRAREDNLTDILARALSNAARSYRELSVVEMAERYYVEVAVLYDELGLVTERARTNWALASLMVKRGDLGAGLRGLESARRELRDLGLLNDHALATLEWAEVRLALEQPRGIADVCREIVMRFESEGMMKNARLAMAYVHEALARGTATPQLLRHIRLYLDALPGRPNNPFVPLQ